VRFLIVEDDESLRERLGRALRDRGHFATTAASGAAARKVGAEGFDAAVVDVRLGAESGLDLIQDLLAIQPLARIVVVTGEMNPRVARDAAFLGAATWLSKPFDADEVLAAVKATGG